VIAGALADPDTSYRYVGMETVNGLHPSFPILEVPFFRAPIVVWRKFLCEMLGSTLFLFYR